MIRKNYPKRAVYRVKEVMVRGEIIGWKIAYKRGLIASSHPLSGMARQLSEWKRHRRVGPVVCMDMVSDVLHGVQNRWYYGWETAPHMPGLYVLVCAPPYGVDVGDPTGDATWNSCRTMYVGQSVHIDDRLRQHASGIIHPSGLPSMYQDMHNMHIVPFHIKIPAEISKSCYRCDHIRGVRDGKSLCELMAVLEQYMMDIADPELNTAPAREIF